MNTKLRAFSILFAFAFAGVVRADLVNIEVTGPYGSAVLTNGGSGPAFGLVNTTGILGVFGANVSDNTLFSTGVIQLTNTSDATETITILATDTNFIASGPGILTSTLSVSNLSSPSDFATNFSGIVGAGGTTTNTIAVSAPSGTSVSAPAFFDLTGPTTLFNNTTVTLAAGSQATLTVTSQLTAVPEPSSMLLVGSALVGFCTFRRRRA